MSHGERDPPATRKVVLTSWDRRMTDGERHPLLQVVLTSWDRRMSDCERDPPAYRKVIWTSWGPPHD